MRTTLDLDDHVLRQAKKLAAEEGKTLTLIIEEAQLKEAIAALSETCLSFEAERKAG